MGEGWWLRKTLKVSGSWEVLGRHGAYFNLRCRDCGYRLGVSRRSESMEKPCPGCVKK